MARMDKVGIMGGTHICKTCGRLDRTLHLTPMGNWCYYSCPFGGRIGVEDIGRNTCAHWMAIE